MDSAARLRRALREVRPETGDELHGWIRAVLGLHVPRRPLTAGHAAPFDYIRHAFFEDTLSPRDAVVWANRGGGKTMLGAVATLLDLVFKPGVQIRILGGSMEQSQRMYLYLRGMLERDEFRDLVEGNMRQRGMRLVTGSQVDLLAQSETSVRGHRVQKLRCDEVELFQPDIWQAAQLVTRSAQCGETYVRGSIECLSTMHRPFGLMAALTAGREEAQAIRRVFRWGLLDVLERCPPQRDCDDCALWPDCGGAAKRGCGHIAIDDAIQQRRRTEVETWQAEMLCLRPSRTDAVYPTFEAKTHVQQWAKGEAVRGDAAGGMLWVGGMDFGFRAPTVVLWGAVDANEVLWIVDERFARECTVEQHIEAIRAAPWPRLHWIGIDPAGAAMNEHSGTSTLRLLRRAGFVPRYRRTSIDAGLRLVRARLRSADGAVRLRIDPRCEHLIEALQRYHYPSGSEDDAAPVKDGPDHAADALRYLVTNLDREGTGVEVRGY